ncbi:MAG: dNTP triphosphohydrolase [Bacteroidaceae bacterium]|nr:dNTP triphosphohydrolase [Bacteroidaceae bacterium]MBR6820496.1 dNTP triphosphohydrolase [Bacteroidaceae bacterium]MBR7052671.1 dNTP triphosphohydrolase [Bacteroidaceae bacterium]
MNWEQLLSNKRFGQENQPHSTDDRTEFQRDYDRLIFSAPFRRLQNKTQVFPLPESIFVHNRLTHSLEVSSVGRSLGNDASRQLLDRHPQLFSTHFTELGNIVSAACLAHDLGNPPFGHSGENAIATYFSEGPGLRLKDYVCPKTGDRLTEAQWNDMTRFEGNANAFRLLTHHFQGRREGGFVMTYSTLASIVKYPYTSGHKGKAGKFGFFRSEEEGYLRIARELGIRQLPAEEGELSFARYPLVYLVEAADDICYEIMDIEDAHKLKILTTEETRSLLLAYFPKQQQEHILSRMSSLDDVNEQIVYLRSCVINCLENECVRVFVEHEEEILEGEFEGSLINYISDIPNAAYKACERVSYGKIYHSKDVVDIEIAGYKIISTLMDLMVEAVIHPERQYSKLLLNRVSPQYETHAPTLYGKLMAVLDYISGMTDVYALGVYRRINGMKIPNL